MVNLGFPQSEAVIGAQLGPLQMNLDQKVAYVLHLLPAMMNLYRPGMPKREKQYRSLVVGKESIGISI